MRRAEKVPRKTPLVDVRGVVRTNDESDSFSKFREDYLEGDRQEPSGLEDLPEEQCPAAESFIRSTSAARGVDPYAPIRRSTNC